MRSFMIFPLVLLGCDRDKSDADDTGTEPLTPGEHPSVAGCTEEIATLVGADDDDPSYKEYVYDEDENRVSYHGWYSGYDYVSTSNYDAEGCQTASEWTQSTSGYVYSLEMSYSCDEHGTVIHGAGYITYSEPDETTSETAPVEYTAEVEYEGENIRSWSTLVNQVGTVGAYSMDDQAGAVLSWDGDLLLGRENYNDFNRSDLGSTEGWTYDERDDALSYTWSDGDDSASLETVWSRDEWGRILHEETTYSTGDIVNFDVTWAEDALRALTEQKYLDGSDEPVEDYQWTWTDETWPWSYQIDQDGEDMAYEDGEWTTWPVDGVIDGHDEVSWSCR